MIVSHEFLKFLHYLCFYGQGILCWHSHWATMFGWSRKPKSTFGSKLIWGYDDSVQWISTVSSVFMFSRSSNNYSLLAFLLKCLVDFENPGKLLVQDVLGGTDDCFSSIFIISEQFMFSRSKNLLLTLPLSYFVWVTSKTFRTGSCPRFPRSLEHDSSEEMSTNDSLTLKT